MVALRFDPIRYHYEAFTFNPRYVLVGGFIAWFVAPWVDPIGYRTEACTNAVIKYMFVNPRTPIKSNEVLHTCVFKAGGVLIFS